MMSPSQAPLLLAALVVVTVIAAHRARASGRSGGVQRRLRGERPAAGVPTWFTTLLQRAEVHVVPERLWLPARWTAALVSLGALAVAPILAVVGVVGGSVALALQPMLRRRRAASAFQSDLPAAIDSLVALVASGSSLAQALGGAAARGGEVGADLALVVARRRHGQSLQQSLDQWSRDRPGTGVSLVADALALAGTSGGSQTRALEGVGATLRERQALAREVRALGSQARTSAVVLVATPVVFAAFVAMADARIRHVLFATPLGWMCIVAGAVLDAVGAWWMARLVSGVR